MDSSIYTTLVNDWRGIKKPLNHHCPPCHYMRRSLYSSYNAPHAFVFGVPLHPAFCIVNRVLFLLEIGSMKREDTIYFRMSLHCSRTLSSAKDHASMSGSTLPIFIQSHPNLRVARRYVMLFNIPIMPRMRTGSRYGSQRAATTGMSNLDMTLNASHVHVSENMQTRSLTHPTMSCLLKRIVPQTYLSMNSWHVDTCGAVALSNGSISCGDSAAEPSTSVVTKFISSSPTPSFRLDHLI